MLFLTSTVSEGDLPHCRIVVRNVIRSGAGAALAAVLLVATPFEFGRAPTDTTALYLRGFTKSVVDPSTSVKGSCAVDVSNSWEYRINGPAELTNWENCWEYHINGPAEPSKSVDDPFVIERRSTVAFEKYCNAESTESVADPFVLVEGSTAAFDKCYGAENKPGTKHAEHEARIGTTREYVLLLKKNLYGLKQASANWHDMLKSALQLIGFNESVADPCVFIK